MVKIYTDMPEIHIKHTARLYNGGMKTAQEFMFSVESGVFFVVVCLFFKWTLIFIELTPQETEELKVDFLEEIHINV